MLNISLNLFFICLCVCRESRHFWGNGDVLDNWMVTNMEKESLDRDVYCWCLSFFHKKVFGLLVCACARALREHQDCHLVILSEPTDTNKSSLGPPPFPSLSSNLYIKGQEPCHLK